MPWYEQHHPTSFEDAPIPGFGFLHGDVVARTYRQEWARGQKFPLITYPTGTTRELVALEQDPQIVLFGDVTLPPSVTRAEAFKALTSHPHVTRLRLSDFEKHAFAVLNRASRRGYRLAFDPATSALANMMSLPEEAMELLPGELRAVLPKLYRTEQQGGQTIAPLKFFTPDSNWTWYPTEFDGNDLFFGLVSGFEVELGYFSLSELEDVHGLFGLPIERDLYYTPQTVDALSDYHHKMNHP